MTETQSQPLPPDEMADLQKCRDEVTRLTASLIERYDVRAVAASLGSAFATVCSTSMAAGMRQFTLEVLVGTLDQFFTPPEKPPVVYYKDQGQLLGRKQ